MKWLAMLLAAGATVAIGAITIQNFVGWNQEITQNTGQVTDNANGVVNNIETKGPK